MKKQSVVTKNPVLKIITKAVSWIVLSFLVLIAGLLIYNIISSKLYEIRGQKYEPELALYTIISPSMEPNINVYDVVVTKKVKDFNTINNGDVITFVSTSTLGEGLTVTHRVVDIVKTEDDIKFRTKGDNNPIADSSLASSKNVMGKVLFKIPWVGHIQFFLQSKGGWLFALLVPAMLIVLYDVYKVIRLSNIKQKVNESIKDKPEDEELIEKKEKLKKNLQEKYEKNKKSKFIKLEKTKNKKEEEPKEGIKEDPTVELEVETKEKPMVEPEVESKEEPMVEQEEETKEKIKVEKVEKINKKEEKVESYIETAPPEKVNEVLENNSIDIKKVLKNIDEVEKQDAEFDISNIMANISKLEDTEEEEINLPRKR